MADHDAGLTAPCPRVLVHTLDGSYVQLASTSADEVMGLIEDLVEGDRDLFSFDLDNGRSQVHVPRAAIARVDVDWELTAWQRFTAWLAAARDRWL